jgi:hypothetical protein
MQRWIMGLITAGQVKDGVIVPNIPLPDRAWVRIEVIGVPIEFTPEERAEFEAWEQASCQSLDWIVRLEMEEELARESGSGEKA